MAPKKTKAKLNSKDQAIFRTYLLMIGNLVIGGLSMHNHVSVILMCALMASWALTILMWPHNKRPAIVSLVLVVACVVSAIAGWRFP